MKKQYLAHYLLFFVATLFFATESFSQNVVDDFEGSGSIKTWKGVDCTINTNKSNPYKQGSNMSQSVLEYNDAGGLYAHVRFDLDNTFNLSTKYTFSLKIYVASNGLSGSQTNQVSLKLQDGTLAEPWTTQSEIIKSISLNTWQTITFNFKDDAYINLNLGSLPPTQRKDFSRVLIQINGENNNDMVLAYIDDFEYDGTVTIDPIYNFLVWSDEFDQNGAIDDDKWFHQTKLPEGGSWYNGEVQHYTNRLANSYVSNGILNILAKKEQYTNEGQTKSYTSARLNSKFAFSYGKVEVRAKLPIGVGTWPAIWMLGKNINEDGAFWDNEGFGTTAWPACGEIDIMEHWGNNQNYVQSAMHTPSSFGNTTNKGGQIITTASSEFHVYTLDWSPEKMKFAVDGIVHYTYNPDQKNANTWPFDKEQYLLLNIAIEPKIAANFTQSTMEVDYVRIYQMDKSTINSVRSYPAKVFPNPATNELTISFEQFSTETIIFNIYNTYGQKLQTKIIEQNGQSAKLDNLQDLSAGSYFIRFICNETAYYIPFIKN